MSLKDQILKLCHQYAGGGRVGYDDGGSVTNPAGEVARELAAGIIPRDWRKVQRNRALAGHEPTPYEQTRIDELNQLLPEYRGMRSREIDEAEFARSLLPDPNIMVRREGVEPVGPDLRRRQQDQLMRGIPLSPEQESARADYMGGLDARREAKANEYDEGASALRLGSELAPFLMPEMKAFAPAVRAAGEMAGKWPAKVAGAIGGVGAAMSPAAANAPGGDERLKEIQAKEAEIAKLSDGLTQLGRQQFVSTKAREEASKPYHDRIAAAQRRIEQIRTEMREDTLREKGSADSERQRILGEARGARDKVLSGANKPFSEAFPTMSEWLPWAPLLAGGAIGALYGLSRAGSERVAARAWDKALEKASNVQRSPATRDLETDVAKRIADSWPQGSSKLAPYVAPGIVGAAEGAIIPNLPHAYNIIRLGDENPERKAMQAYYRGLQGLPDDDPEIVRTGKLLADENALPKGNAPFQEAKNYFSDFGQMMRRSAAGAGEGFAGTLPGTTIGTALSPGERALATRRARTEALNERRPGSGATPPTNPAPTPLTPSGGALEPAQRPYIPLPPALPAPEPALPRTPKAPAVEETTKLPVASSSQPALQLPKGYTNTPHGVRHDASGQFATPPKPKRNGKGKELTNGKQDDPAAEYFADPTKLTRGQRSGGAVLDKARQYANGGVVTHGLVRGDTGGRTDALDVDVPNRSFVLPADVVSALGEGNTDAGAAAWAKILPPTKGMADGGVVPIRISHGEIVVNPDQVAALGGGNHAQGFRVLEHAVKKVRSDNIKHLSKLPGPAKA